MTLSFEDERRGHDDHCGDSTIHDLRLGRGRPGVTDAAALRLELTDEEKAAIRAIEKAADH